MTQPSRSRMAIRQALLRMMPRSRKDRITVGPPVSSARLAGARHLGERRRERLGTEHLRHRKAARGVERQALGFEKRARLPVWALAALGARSSRQRRQVGSDDQRHAQLLAAVTVRAVYVPESDPSDPSDPGCAPGVACAIDQFRMHCTAEDQAVGLALYGPDAPRVRIQSQPVKRGHERWLISTTD